MTNHSTGILKECRNCQMTFRVRVRDEHTRHYCTKSCMKAYETNHGRVARRVGAIPLTCEHCKEPFGVSPGALNRSIKQYGRAPLYCSQKCTGLARRVGTETEQTFACEECGTIVPRRKYNAIGRTKFYSQQRFCSMECKAANQRTIALARFEAGSYKKYIGKKGYVLISVPSLVTGKKHTVTEHRYVMEQHLGRKLLPEETVHHINGDRQFNELRNLELFSSRHGPGQRVIDKITFAIEMLRLYPEFAREAGVKLVDLHQSDTD